MRNKYCIFLVVFGLVFNLFSGMVLNVEASGDFELSVCTSTSDGHVSKKGTDYALVHAAGSGDVNGIGTSFVIGQWASASIPSAYYLYRGFVFFDTSNIPENAVIDSAWLNLTGYSDYSTQEFYIVVQDGQPTYPHDPLIASDYLYSRYSGDGGTVYSTAYPNLDIELNSSGKGWINKGGTTKLCLRSDREIASDQPVWTDNEYIRVHTRESSSTECSWLNITYSIPTDVSVSLNIPVSGVGYADEHLPVGLNVTVNETADRDMTINLYGDDSLIDTHFTSGNEIYEYDWAPTVGGIHEWYAIVNCSEGIDYGVWNDVDATTYCSYSTGTYSYMGITNVAMNDGELDHSSGYSNTPYEDFTFTGCNLSLGDTFELDVTLGGTYTQALAVWVDWNNDTVLDSGERTVGDSTGGGTGTVLHAQITVPSDAVTNGSVLMRVITDYQTTPEDNPCQDPDVYGDCEDYSIKVKSNVYDTSETRWFAVNYFNDTFTDSTYVNDSDNVTFVDSHINFTLVDDNIWYVTTGVNDGYSRSGVSSVYATSDYFYTGGGTTTYDDWIMVSNVNISQSTVIDNAFLNTYSRMVGTPDMDIWGNDVDTPSRPTTRPDFLDKVKTTSHTDFDGVGGTTYNWQEWDVTCVVQELVDTRGYVDEDMQFLLYNDTTGTSHYYYHYSYEYGTPDGVYTPELHVSFINPDRTGNVTSVNISKPSGYYWDNLFVHTNQSGNLHCNFSILNESGEVLMSGLDGLDNGLWDLGNGSEYDTIRLFGEFNSDVTMFSWNVSWVDKRPMIRFGYLDGEGDGTGGNPLYDEVPANNSVNITFNTDGFYTNLSIDYTLGNIDYKKENYTESNSDHYVNGKIWNAQTFTPGEHFYLTRLVLKLSRDNYPGDLVISIRNVDGSGKPTGNDLVTIINSTDNFITSEQGTWYTFSTNALLKLSSETQYAIVLRCPDSPPNAVVDWRADSSAPTYPGGSRVRSLDGGSSWTVVTGTDFTFETWGVNDTDANWLNLTFDWYNNTLKDWQQYGFIQSAINNTYSVFNENFLNLTGQFKWRVSALASDTGVTHVEWYVFNVTIPSIIFSNENPTNNSYVFYNESGINTSVTISSGILQGEVDKEHYNLASTTWRIIKNNDWASQIFEIDNNFIITKVRMKMFRYRTPGELTVGIRLVDGSGKPTGEDLTNGTYDADTLTTSSSGEWIDVELDKYQMDKTLNYSIVCRAVDAGSDNIKWKVDGSHPVYFDGHVAVSLDAGSSWSIVSSHDASFEVWGISSWSNMLNITLFDNTSGFWVEVYNTSIIENSSVFYFNPNFSGIGDNMWRVNATANDTGITHSEWYQFNTVVGVKRMEPVSKATFLLFSIVIFPFWLIWKRKQINKGIDRS